jgi:DNA-binding MarR family transcriptional regulator
MAASSGELDAIPMPALLRHARVTYGAAMRRALEAAGYDDLPKNGLYVIGGLRLANGEFALGRLIRDLSLSKQAAGQLVETLVTRGYLRRRVDDQDRRRVLVTLTERGSAAAQVQAAERARIDAQLLEKVGAESIAHARRVLATLIDLGAPRA